jgi:hypothetical protein
MLIRTLKKRLQFNLAEKCAGSLEPKVESAFWSWSVALVKTLSLISGHGTGRSAL